mmetsp:Transcript_4743/g.12982  ORF Transcript_4743/g.12982 Transcript_4743/m.12982 type:complete len:225 (-) Transcript_4743:61-735(-)
MRRLPRRRALTEAAAAGGCGLRPGSLAHPSGLAGGKLTARRRRRPPHVLGRNGVVQAARRPPQAQGQAADARERRLPGGAGAGPPVRHRVRLAGRPDHVAVLQRGVDPVRAGLGEVSERPAARGRAVQPALAARKHLNNVALCGVEALVSLQARRGRQRCPLRGACVEAPRHAGEGPARGAVRGLALQSRRRRWRGLGGKVRERRVAAAALPRAAPRSRQPRRR